MENERLLTVAEVAGMLRVNKITVQTWTRDGALSGIRVGREWRYKKEDIEDYLERNRHTAEAAVA